MKCALSDNNIRSRRRVFPVVQLVSHKAHSQALNKECNQVIARNLVRMTK
jgi:hypothetical protein